MSRSESLEIALRIRCFSSTIARWDEREDDGGGGGVVIDDGTLERDDGWLDNLLNLVDLGPWEPIFGSIQR